MTCCRNITLGLGCKLQSSMLTGFVALVVAKVEPLLKMVGLQMHSKLLRHMSSGQRSEARQLESAGLQHFGSGI